MIELLTGYRADPNATVRRNDNKAWQCSYLEKKVTAIRQRYFCWTMVCNNFCARAFALCNSKNKTKLIRDWGQDFLSLAHLAKWLH